MQMTDDTTLMAESKEELKNLLRKVKEDSEISQKALKDICFLHTIHKSRDCVVMTLCLLLPYYVDLL